MTKVVFIGVGSYVFGPSFLADLLADPPTPLELVLVDRDERAADRMVAVARRLGADRDIRVVSGTHWEGIGDGADFVVCAAAPRVRSCFLDVVDACRRHAPMHRITEFGGVHGLDATLRQVTFIGELCGWIRNACPSATLLNVTNPLPRVAAAAESQGVRTIGFCSAALEVYAWIGVKLGLTGAHRWPFREARRRHHAVASGTNHFTFLLKLIDRATGVDVWPEVRNAWLSRPPVPMWEMAERLAAETGHMPCINDLHLRDFLSPSWDYEPMVDPQHGNAAEREALHDRLDRFARGDLATWDEVGTTPAWERPDVFIREIVRNGSATFDALDLRIGERVVEVPAQIINGSLLPTPLELPQAVAGYVSSATRTHDLFTRAALTPSAENFRAALEHDATVTDVDEAVRAFAASVAAHPDLVSSQGRRAASEPTIS